MASTRGIGPLGKKSYIKLEKGYQGEELSYHTPKADWAEVDGEEYLFIGFTSLITILATVIITLPLNILLTNYIGNYDAIVFVLELIYALTFHLRNFSLPITYTGDSRRRVDGFESEEGQKLLASMALEKSGEYRYLSLREERVLNRYAKNKNDGRRAEEITSHNEEFNKFILEKYGSDLKDSKLALEASRAEKKKLEEQLQNMQNSHGELTSTMKTGYKLDKIERMNTYNYIAGELRSMRVNDYKLYTDPLRSVLNSFDELSEPEKRNYLEVLSILKDNISTYLSLSTMAGIDSDVVRESRQGIDSLLDVMIKPVRAMAQRLAESKRDKIMIDSIYANDKYRSL